MWWKVRVTLISITYNEKHELGEKLKKINSNETLNNVYYNSIKVSKYSEFPMPKVIREYQKRSFTNKNWQIW